MAKKYDVVVIGAGNGGLMAAAKLAKEGKKTLLLEKHNLPGGSATSFVRGRFEFEASLHELCGMGPYNPERADLRQRLEDIGVADRIEWIALDEAFRIITMHDKDNIDLTLPVGKEAFIDAVEAYAPGNREKCEKLFDVFHRMNLGVDYLGTITDFHPSIVTDILFKHDAFIDSASYTVQEVFDALELPKIVQDCFAGYWLYLGTSLDKMSFLHYFSMFESYAVDGPVIPKSRSHEISSAILDRFEELGGECWLNSEVTEIKVTDGVTSGVVLATGEEIDCDYIVCNASPYNLYTKLLKQEDVPTFQKKKLNSVNLAPKGFSVFIGLDASIEELGVENHSYFIFDTADTVKQIELTKSRENNNMQAAVFLNHTNPDCSPEGTSILYLTALFTGEDAWKDVTPENYVATKRAFADKMISNFEEATGIQIRDHIEEIEIAAPATYCRYLGAPNGTIYGFANEGSYDIVSRIVTDFIGPNVKHLYYGGGYGTRSLGFNPSYATGHEAAKALLLNMEKEAKKA